ncbi:ABC-F family ATP-binding cassette domain-containing protein [Brevibacterium senegalense]|uniref:ABC-F family ATP-binding cassette domain-containing protein n=1 Tax=Brevibacterium senegalense TaxID=1033736 RepID=UPI00030D558B|nr:ABC-F family ATP-binding cassette domain-containing protein [Brevibacterium senegalense]
MPASSLPAFSDPAHAPSVAPTSAPTGAPSAAHLRADGISLSYGARRVLTDVSLTVYAGERAGLIGENGSGKSTLLRILAGLQEPDVGTVRATAPGGRIPRIGLLHQEPPFPPTDTVAQALESAVAPIRQAEHDLDRAASALAGSPQDGSAVHAYTRALETAQDLRVWEIDSRIESLLAGLGLADVPRDRPTRELSGGQASRLSLAWLLLSAPDVLLLDEPTNHLDDSATAHLRDVLASWPGPVLLTSHDRAFLDEAVTALLDLDPAPIPHAVAGGLLEDGTGTGIGLTRFTGAYTDYLRARRDERARWERQYRDEQQELTRLRAAVGENQTVGHHDWKPRTESRMARKFYADRNAKVVSRRVKDSRNRLADLDEHQIRKPPQELRFAGFQPGTADAPAEAARTTAVDPPAAVAGTAGSDRASAGVPSGTDGQATGTATVLSASGAGVAGRLAPTDLLVRAGEKWLITGANGAGKSTLLHVLADRLDPTSGRVERAPGLRIGLLSQEVDLPDPGERGPERTVAQAYEDLVGTARAQRTPVTDFGLLAGRDLHRPVASLSVGQQRRLELAVLLADTPDILLLDEPTNHLSILLVTQLEAAIHEHAGTVLVASHDRWLRRGWSGQTLHV